MGVTVCSRGEVLDTELCNRSGFRAKICDIDDNKSLRYSGIEEGKNKVRAAKARIDYCYIVGKCELLHLLNYRRSKAVIGEQGVSAPRNYDLWKQHGKLHSTG